MSIALLPALQRQLYTNLAFVQWTHSAFSEETPVAAIALVDELEPTQKWSYRWVVGNSLWSAGENTRAIGVWGQADLSEIGANMVRLSNYYSLADQEGYADRWLTRADELGVCAIDVWYQRGHLAETNASFELALEHYTQSASMTQGCGTYGRADAHYRMGVIWQWNMSPPDWETALDHFRSAVGYDDFSNTTVQTDAYYQLAFRLFTFGPENDSQTIEALRKALELQADHSWANLLMGRAIYRRDGDSAVARQYMEHALSLAQNRGAVSWQFPFALGELYEAEDAHSEAIAYYQQAYNISPGRRDIVARLERLGVQP